MRGSGGGRRDTNKRVLNKKASEVFKRGIGLLNQAVHCDTQSIILEELIKVSKSSNNNIEADIYIAIKWLVRSL